MSILKMMILPKFIYFFKCSLWTYLRLIFTWRAVSFPNWFGRVSPPHLSYQLLCRTKVTGGLGLPDLLLYYLENALRWIVNWNLHVHDKLWVPLEKMLAGWNLAHVPWLDRMHRGLTDSTCLLSNSTLAIWDRVNMKHWLASFPSPLSPLGAFPWFVLENIGPFLACRGHSVEVRCFQFLSGLELKSQAEPSREWGATQLDTWRHLQLWDFFRGLQSMIWGHVYGLTKLYKLLHMTKCTKFVKSKIWKFKNYKIWNNN